MPTTDLIFPTMPPISGVALGTTNAGIKQTTRDDLLLISIAKNGVCAGVFTQNAFCAAPVQIAKANLAKQPRWLCINSGNANAGTGSRGTAAAQQCCQKVGQLMGGEACQVLPFSTGVIGEDLPDDKIIKALPAAKANLHEDNWLSAATAIMTTDTAAKGASRTVQIGTDSITINGIAKGSGMVHPNMATLLAFIATDAKISQPLLQQALSAAVAQSFNLITIDGDTSTNDACVLLASQSAQAEIASDEDYAIFVAALGDICCQLARLVVQDGEGASKLIRIQVGGAASDAEAVLVGKTIANSPLVKTAFFASDPNWGRILAAIGRAEISNLDISKVSIYLDNICVLKNGAKSPKYTEQQGQKVMGQNDITLAVNLGRGSYSQQILSCDLSFDYVRINSEYRS